MYEVDLIIKNGKIYGNGILYESSIAVNEGKIAAIGDENLLPKAKKVIDAKNMLVLPGGIDPHVHIREPGRPDRGTFLTETMAAAAGGVTTILEHPIAKPPQYSPEILKRRINDAKTQCLVDFAFYGAAGAEFPEKIKLMANEGIVAFKTFLHAAPENREQEFIGLTMANDGEMYKGFSEVAKTGKICAVHAENNDIISTITKELKRAGRKDYIAHCEARPPICEYETVSKLLHLSKELGVKMLFCHISTPEAMELIKQAKMDGLEVYLETCPHYLFLSEEELTKHGTYAKCNPPLRDKARVEKLWDYIEDGTVDIIGSDHATYTSDEKSTNDIFAAPAGFPGVELRLPLLLDAVNNGKLTLERAVDILCVNVSKIFNLYPVKGVIQTGADADFVIVDMNSAFIVDKNKSYSKSREISRIYEGLELKGKLEYTIVRGNIVMEQGVVSQENAGWGQWIKPLR